MAPHAQYGTKKHCPLKPKFLNYAKSERSFRSSLLLTKNIENMYKTITKELSKCELIDIMMGMDCEEDMCTHTSIQRVLCPIQACDEFGGDPEDSRPLLPEHTWLYIMTRWRMSRFLCLQRIAPTSLQMRTNVRCS